MRSCTANSAERCGQTPCGASGMLATFQIRRFRNVVSSDIFRGGPHPIMKAFAPIAKDLEDITAVLVPSGRPSTLPERLLRALML